MRKILIGLKNKTDLKILKEFLREEKFEIISYDYENSEKIDENVDLIIVDEFCAEKCLEKIKELKSSQKVFLPAVSLISHKVKSEPFLKAGFDDIIRYPLSKSEFLSRIKNLLMIREQSERILKESEEKYRLIVEKSHSGILVIDDNFRIVYANDRGCELAGRERDEIIGHDFREFLAEDSKELVADRYVRRQKGERVPERYEFNIVRKDGEIRNVEIISAVIEDSRGKKFTISQILDITERKRAEQELKKYTQELEKIVEERTKELAESEKRYRSLVESPLVAFWEADANGNFTFVNKRLVEMAGYDSEEEIAGKLNMAECIVHEQRDWLLKRMELHRKGKLGVEVVEAKLKKKDGSTFDVLVSPAPIYDDKGNFIKVIGAMIDISDRKKLEEKLISANKELESFAFTVSHDLRAPLRAMQGFANALLEDYGDKLDKTARFYAERIIRASQNMDMLIKDLLEYSRIGRIDLRMQKLKPDIVIEQVISSLESQIKEKRAEIKIEKPMPEIKADRNFLFQIFLNLISNAIKFVEEDKIPEVRIWAEEKDEFIRFWVEDNGIGIPKEYQDKIFNIFERLHGSERYSGTGVGLAIVKRCVERMGGKVGVISEEGKGSKFWFEILKGG